MQSAQSFHTVRASTLASIVQNVWLHACNIMVGPDVTRAKFKSVIGRLAFEDTPDGPALIRQRRVAARRADESHIADVNRGAAPGIGFG